MCEYLVKISVNSQTKFLPCNAKYLNLYTIFSWFMALMFISYCITFKHRKNIFENMQKGKLMTFAVYREVTAELFCCCSHFKDLQGQFLFRIKGSVVIYRAFRC